MIQLAYAGLTSAFESTKHGISKAVLSEYANKTSVVNMLFMKHMIKTFFYILLVILLTNESLQNSFTNISNIVTDTFNLKYNENMKIFIAIALVAFVEIAYSFPYYTGIRKFELSTFILMITIFTVIFNMLLGKMFFDEKFTIKKIMGIIVCIIGITLIRNDL
jgi:multidrug transporter EmrE-like cation transporter